MDSIEGRFTIMVNGLAVTTAEDNADPKVHAAVGRDPAIFTLTRGRLESGDWILGRSLIEDRSLLPKGIYWFKKTSTDVELVQQSTAIPEAGSYKLMFAGKRR
ncbi:hypothetical protein N7462_007360 [Penicillium macrosclerotiorum]|uniref:uncharacterized protein n=1 Tax=Penicillium macrosclerotiorum TaxID=303699 RepID=UPI002546E7BE|nr:uncharacterized protein N7462_007360 [Penicillium macrosclerotiorum]KAJ5679116.1 hypothetical protein N7462_007360 [Penicillium macrosclerotiorum]